MKKIIIAAEYLDGRQNSTGFYWSGIVTGLRRRGLPVEVVGPTSYNAYHFSGGSSGFFRKAFRQIVLSFHLFFRVARLSNRGDTVFIGTNPAILLCLMPVLKFLCGVRWVVLVHDVFPDNFISAGFVRESNILYRVLRQYASFVYSASDKLICIGRDMQALLEFRTGRRGKAVFVPNWADGSEVFPLPRADIQCFHESAKDRKIVFQFFGNIGRLQGIENLLSAISQVSSDNAAFLFVGGGAMAPAVSEFVKSFPDRNVHYVGAVPLAEKNVVLSMCDVAIVSLENGMMGLGVPSKTYFSLAAGRPILAVVEAGSEVGQMMVEFPVGWRCDPGRPAELANMIDKICASPHLINEKKPRAVFLENFSEEIVMQKLYFEINAVFAGNA